MEDPTDTLAFLFDPPKTCRPGIKKGSPLELLTHEQILLAQLDAAHNYPIRAMRHVRLQCVVINVGEVLFT